jgi:hypothetical protein
MSRAIRYAKAILNLLPDSKRKVINDIEAIVKTAKK